MIFNNTYKFNNLICRIKKGQNLLILERLNPIFASPKPEQTNGGIMVIFHDYQREQTLEKDKLLWMVVGNIAVCYSYKVQENSHKPYARYLLLKEAPFYIQALARPALKQYKKSVVTISDDLPLSISLTINYPRNQRENVLNSIAYFLNAQDLTEVRQIISDKSISLKESLHNILKFTGAETCTDFSICLTCGRNIESGKKFCDATNYKYKNKNQCLIQLNYWLKARLGINTTIERSRMRNKFCKEMVELIKEFPLSAYEEFELRHPKLYEKRYKARWERERRLKQ